jgi:Tfp pilus assembly protein PilE
MLRRKLAWVFLSACGGLLFFSCGGKEKKKEAPATGAKETPRVEVIRTERAPEAPAAVPASAFSSLDERIPPGTVFLVAVRDAKKFLSDFKTTALYQAIMDPALSEWRKQALGYIADFGQGENEFSLESGPWKDEFQKDMVFGILMPEKGKSEPAGIFFITDQRGHEEEHRIFVKEKILNYLQKPKNPILISQEEIEGIVVGTFGPPNRPGLYCFEKDEIFTYASARGAVEKLVHQALKPEQTFRSSPSYRKALASIPPGHVGDPVVMYLDVASLVEQATLNMEATPLVRGEALRKNMLVNISGLSTIQTISGSTRIEDHAFRSAFCVKFSGPRQGMMDIFGEPAAGGPEILNYLPEDAVFAGELRLKSGIEIWQKFLTAVQSSVTPERYMTFQKNIANMQAQLGVNLQDDIFTPLDGRIGYAVGGALPMSPTVAIFAGCRDQKRLLAAIGSMLGKTTPPSSGQGSYRDIPYSIYPIPESMNQLSCAAVGDFVVITNQAAALEKCIDIYKDKKGGLAASEKFQRHAAKLPGKAVMFGYNELEKMISTMVGVMTMSSSPRPTLPDFSVLIKYFFGNSMAVVCGPDSLTVESFASFTGGLPLILTVGANYLPRSDAGFSEANIRSRISRAKSDQRSLANALEAYYVDNNSYVSWATGDQGVNNFLPAGSASRGRPTFRRPSAGGPMTLTTPLAYITQLQPDPFAPDKGAVHSYYCDGGGWILLSAGPDGDYDIDPQKLYNSSVPQPSAELLSKNYDVTNGTVSDGDIFRVKM